MTVVYSRRCPPSARQFIEKSVFQALASTPEHVGGAVHSELPSSVQYFDGYCRDTNKVRFVLQPVACACQLIQGHPHPLTTMVKGTVGLPCAMVNT